MKNMNFMLRGLMKAGLMTLLLFAGQSLVAQSFSTQPDDFNQSNQTKATISTTYVGSSEAISSLNAEAMALRDAVATTDVEKLTNEYKMKYFRHIGGLINTGSTPASALNQSVSYLTSILSKVGDAPIDLTAWYQEANDLISN